MSYDYDEANAEPVAPGKIKVVCHGCGARYQVRDSKVRGHRFRATCKRCGGIIVARCTNAFTVMPDQGRGRGGNPGALRVPAEELQEDEASWYVVIAGKPHGPLMANQVRQSFSSQRITARTYMWRVGDPEWRRLAEVPEFGELFGEETTGFYDTSQESEQDWIPTPDGELDRGIITGETRAAGPQGLRREQELDEEPTTSGRDHFYAAGTLDPEQHRLVTPNVSEDGSESSASGRTTVQASPEESDPQATRMHSPARVARATQPEQWMPPPVTPRRAMLPSPTGAARHPPPRPVEEAARQDGGPQRIHSAGGDGRQGRPDDLTRPLAAEERRDARSAPPPPQLNFARSAPAPLSPPASLGGPPLLLAVPPAFAPAPFAPGLPLPTAPRSAALGSSAFLPEAGLAGLAPTSAPPGDPSPLASLLEPPGAGLAAAAREDPLRPLGVPPQLLPVKDDQRSFWTPGKIAGVAAIGGGLAVAAAVVLVVTMMRPKQRTISEEPRVTQPPPSKSAPPLADNLKITINSPPPEPKPDPQAEQQAAVAGAAANQEPATTKRDKPAQTTPEEPDEPAPKVVTPTRTKLKTKAVAKSKGGRVGAGEPLLGATRPAGKKAAKKGGAPEVSDDDILAAGGGGKKPTPKKKGGGAAANDDDILGGGARKPGSSGGALPEKPTREQISGAIRPLLARVRGCHDQYQQAGLVQVQIALQPNGGTSPNVVGSFAGTPTGFCIMKALGSLRVPRFSGAAFSIVYPINLQ